MKTYGGYNPEYKPVSRHLRVVSEDEPSTRLDWREDAACLESDPEIFFYKETAEAKEICRTCDVAADCLAFAIKNGLKHGVFGGATPAQRKRLQGREIDDDEPMAA